MIALLDEALAALEREGAADGDPARWRLSASLARELADGPDGDLPRAVDFARAAVDGARGTGDAGVLAYALFALADVRWAPGTAAERLEIAGELATAVVAAHETELVLEGRSAPLVALLELGDPHFTVELATFIGLAEQAAIPRYLYLARSRQATAMSLTGPFEAADQAIEEAAAYGERIGEPDTWGVQASQLAGLAYIRHDWTRLSQLAAARGRAIMPPEFALHLRAWLLLEAGEKAAAAALVASIPDGPTMYRWRHTAMLTSDAELAAAVGDRNRCAARYEQLLPMAGEFAVVGAAVFTTGPVALQLGLLAAALERWDDAAAHLDDAIRRCDRLGADLLAARARTELARVRAAQGHTPPGNGGSTNVFRREGDMSTLAFGGRGVPLRDAKGLRDLAVLLAAPGREVAATELIAGVTTAAAAGLAGLGADPVLDDRARTAYRTRLARLDEELAEADTHHDIERSARLAAERDALIDELTSAAGLGGRPRRLGDVTERARTTVTARIRDAIGRIERVHPELGRHLRASIVTGARCSTGRPRPCGGASHNREAGSHAIRAREGDPDGNRRTEDGRGGREGLRGAGRGRHRAAGRARGPAGPVGSAGRGLPYDAERAGEQDRDGRALRPGVAAWGGRGRVYRLRPGDRRVHPVRRDGPGTGHRRQPRVADRRVRGVRWDVERPGHDRGVLPHRRRDELGRPSPRAQRRPGALHPADVPGGAGRRLDRRAGRRDRPAAGRRPAPPTSAAARAPRRSRWPNGSRPRRSPGSTTATR